MTFFIRCADGRLRRAPRCSSVEILRRSISRALQKKNLYLDQIAVVTLRLARIRGATLALMPSARAGGGLVWLAVLVPIEGQRLQLRRPLLVHATLFTAILLRAFTAALRSRATTSDI
ncbi:hypothetical protein JQ557_00835 [Bradyrhizobium sp. U87765 SZCCT0131]|uniref:hypothetical protein n=1 Tax=unclassified Bradyrhizobium TaxID=2631580 RepID=UPI001BA5CAE2|nr:MULTISPECIES: hypothetical protein [unclassified Bradyrhizobium]MBR1216517.1 hypothetical protein [Bradyrhizobium sp. U87765 SZCCT0131]MBR1259727.1 hypothetical protein [Bradyrhizobium sp. U87765 SZCCT0134]MBR1305868.1 hypothetical protein [Bradyrhizobium sp. U87765 SZCCT0110]MBR1322235.1 hypothetical protein [Bradyrhizobium sp. U87765 SZCCT0109]MBR1350486.1 hypothetical protein [Bradyrhizobium sp. U87765 SZCCT0048]